MTTYTITTTQNVTALAAKAGGDTYTINGGTLLIDCDSRYGLNQTPTTGPLGTISMSASLGGLIKIDGTKVRLIPYTSGTGNVPAAGTTITQGSVTSELLGVWSAINTTPTAAGSAMPASGFIKVRNVSGGAGVYASGALTGIGATSRGADIVGWIEVIGKEALTFSTTKLGGMTVQGAWMSPFDSTGAEIQTSGVAGQAIQLPASVTNTFYGGVWVETSAGSGVYDKWPSVNGLVNAAISTTDTRGRVCWITGAGVLTFGSDGTNTVGLVPPSGCRIRFGNVLCGNTNTTVGLAANSLPTMFGVGTRYFSTTSTGSFTFDLCHSVWGIGLSAPYAISITNCTIAGLTQLTNPSTYMTVTGNMFVQRDSAAGDNNQMVSVSAYAGATFSNNVVLSQTQTSANMYLCGVFITNGVMNSNRFHIASRQAAAMVGALSTTLTSSTADSNEFIGMAGNWTLNGSTVTNSKLATWGTGTAIAQASNAIILGNGSQNSTIDGVSWLISDANTCHPYTALVVFNAVNGVKVRNFGTFSAPLSLGTVNPTQNPAFTIGFQTTVLNCAIQKCYLSGSPLSVAQGSYVTNTNFGVENVNGGSGSSNNSLSQANSYLRAYRTNSVYLSPSAAAVGLHWADLFFSDTVGTFQILMTDASTSTAGNTTDQMQITGGAPKWTGALGGGLMLNSVGDQVTWTMKYFAQGHTGFSAAPTMVGGTISQYLVEFRADVNDGNGWSAWQTASTAALNAVSVNAANGVKLAVRLTCTTANASTISSLRFGTTTTLTAQQAVSYPLDPVTITVTNIVAGSRIKVVRTDTNAVLDNAAVVGTSYSLTGDYSGMPVQVEVRCATPPGPYYQSWIGSGMVLSTGLAIQALQVRDDQ